MPLNLKVGTSMVDITPALPVALDGQRNSRIAEHAATPLTASIIALESLENGSTKDMAIMVSCDLLLITDEILGMVRNAVKKKQPGIDAGKIFLNATHIHTGPVTRESDYPIPKEGVTRYDEYRDFLVDRLSVGIVKAWQNRSAGSVTWGLGHAVMARNRRAVFADNSARIYAATDVPEFRHMEGYEDHDVNMLFFRDQDRKLTAIAINVACPAQEVEMLSEINADYWYPVRVALQERFGYDLCVLGWIGASGDQSPHLMFAEAAEERMRRLRNLSRLDEIARRIIHAVDEAYTAVENDFHSDVMLSHLVDSAALPMRRVTEQEYNDAKEFCQTSRAKIAADPSLEKSLNALIGRYENVVDRFEKQKTDPNSVLNMELHVLRIGDAVVCTNIFELFTDFGIRIRARSKAEQTFVIQLAGPGSYLPTERAVQGGGYGAQVSSNLAGPEGGQVLVERTVELIDRLWE